MPNVEWLTSTPLQMTSPQCPQHEAPKTQVLAYVVGLFAVLRRPITYLDSVFYRMSSNVCSV
eukprot:6477093-Amphidinium_carterae.1